MRIVLVFVLGVLLLTGCAFRHGTVRISGPVVYEGSEEKQ